jgi:hypothetical protein
MKITIELNPQEEMKLIESITKVAKNNTGKIISDYFKHISVDDFVMLLRRSFRASIDSFFQHYMQFYIEKHASSIFKKLMKDSGIDKNQL